MKGVIDRFEGEFAIVILESDEVINVLRQQLPSNIIEGSHVKVFFDDKQGIQAIELDQVGTESANQRIQEKLERLRRNEHVKKDE